RLPTLAGALSPARSVTDAVNELAGPIPVAPIPPPPNLPVQRTPLPPGPPWRLLFLGHLRPYKGLDVALGALRRLVDDGHDVRLHVAGNPWRPPEEWRERAEALGVTDHVHFRFEIGRASWRARL